jgi:hypothetical protein
MSLVALLLAGICSWLAGCSTEYNSEYEARVSALQQEYRQGHMTTTEYCERLDAIEGDHQRYLEKQEEDRQMDRMMKDAEERNESRQDKKEHED